MGPSVPVVFLLLRVAVQPREHRGKTLEMARLQRQSDKNLKGKRILIVEDNPLMGEILKELLASYDHASHASSGKEALKQIKRNPPDIILLDLTLPDVSGLEVATSVRRNKKTESIPILAMSATPVEKRRWLKAGCTDFILKPFSIPNLLGRLSMLLHPK